MPKLSGLGGKLTVATKITVAIAWALSVMPIDASEPINAVCTTTMPTSCHFSFLIQGIIPTQYHPAMIVPNETILAYTPRMIGLSAGTHKSPD
jgi:hypothetical protein